MYNQCIDTTPAKAEKKHLMIESVALNSIRNVLPNNLIEQASLVVDYDYRNRLLSPIVTVLHMVTAAGWKNLLLPVGRFSGQRSPAGSQN